MEQISIYKHNQNKSCIIIYVPALLKEKLGAEEVVIKPGYDRIMIRGALLKDVKTHSLIKHPNNCGYKACLCAPDILHWVGKWPYEFEGDYLIIYKQDPDEDDSANNRVSRLPDSYKGRY